MPQGLSDTITDSVTVEQIGCCSGSSSLPPCQLSTWSHMCKKGDVQYKTVNLSSPPSETHQTSAVSHTHIKER